MRGYFKQLTKRVQTASRRSGFGYILILALLSLPMLISPSARANDKRVVSLYVDNQTTTFATDADTVGQALTDRGVTLNQHDIVEPSADTPINVSPFHINVYRARPVLVIDGQQSYPVISAYQSSRLIAEQAGLEVYDEDEFQLERIENFLSEGVVGLKLTIQRATPLTLSLYGTTSQIRTQAGTVAELLAERGLSADGEDVLRPAAQTSIKSGMKVFLIRVSDDRVVVEESVQFDRREIKDTSQPLGWEKIITPGQTGSALVTYEVVFEDGREVSRREVSRVNVSEPVMEVAYVGAKYDLADAFAKLRLCEAGGAYDRNSGNGFYGAYQFMYQTWQSVAPDPWKNTYPHEAPPSIQDQAARSLQRRSGWGQWPACSAKLGLL
jgi:uncharacterized protein YabE (DUF348 family)